MSEARRPARRTERGPSAKRSRSAGSSSHARSWAPVVLVLTAIALVGLVVVGAVGIGLWMRARSLEAEHERTVASVQVAVQYNPDVCGMEKPLAVSARNTGTGVVKSVYYRVRGYEPGDSTAHEPSTATPFALVLRPGEARTACENPQYRWPLGPKEHAFWSGLNYVVEVYHVEFFKDGEFVP